VGVSATGLAESGGVQAGQRIEDLDTPTILVDLDRMERNIAAWQGVADANGVRLRPHIKTHKVPAIALEQVEAGARGIIAAKVSEAEPFIAAGIDDVCIAYPVFGEDKWARIARHAARGVKMTVNCDNDAAARQASRAAVAADATIHLQIDVDSGMHRGGIPMDRIDEIERLARAIQSLPGLEFDGLTTHRGIWYEGSPGPADAGHDEGQLLVDLAEKLRAGGHEVREITAGGTFTGKWVAEVPGVTETRAGTYVYYDLMHINAGTADWDDLALTALCRVVSHPSPDRVTIDGGSKTFSGDRGVVGGSTFAKVNDLAVGADRKVFVERLTEEHGMARAEEPVELGDRIRFYPFHACTCANLTNEVVAHRGGTVEAMWKVEARGLRQ
jgi:D-serine deaminase-like pyridoxal phosphate-dependent protein